MTFMSLTPGSPAGPDWTGFFKTLFTIKFIKGSTINILYLGQSVLSVKCSIIVVTMVLATLMNYDIK